MLLRVLALSAIGADAITTIYRSTNNGVAQFSDYCPCPVKQLTTGSTSGSTPASGKDNISGGGGSATGGAAGSNGQTVAVVGHAGNGQSPSFGGVPSVVAKVEVVVSTYVTVIGVPVVYTTVKQGVTVTATSTSTVTSTVTTTVNSVPSAFALQIGAGAANATTLQKRANGRFIATDNLSRLSDNSFQPSAFGQYSFSGSSLQQDGQSFFMTAPDMFEGQVSPTNNNIGPLIQKGAGSALSFGISTSAELTVGDSIGTFVFCVSQPFTDDYCGAVFIPDGAECDSDDHFSGCETSSVCVLKGDATTGTCRPVCDMGNPDCGDNESCTSEERTQAYSMDLLGGPIIPQDVCEPRAAVIVSSTSEIASQSTSAADQTTSTLDQTTSAGTTSIIAETSSTTSSASTSATFGTSTSATVSSVSEAESSSSRPAAPSSSSSSSFMTLTTSSSGLPFFSNSTTSSIPSSPSSTSTTSTSTTSAAASTTSSTAPVSTPNTTGLHVRLYRNAAEAAAAGIKCDVVRLFAVPVPAF